MSLRARATRAVIVYTGVRPHDSSVGQNMGIGIATLVVFAAGHGDEDVAGLLVHGRLTAAGHRIVADAQVDSESRIRSQLQRWIADSNVTAIVMTARPASVRALAPLITEQLAHHVRCGSTLVFLLPNSMAATSDMLDRIVLPELSRPGRELGRADMHITTDAIAVIGGLPPAADATPLVDLRRGKLGLWTLALAGAAFAGGLAGVTLNAIKRNQVEVAQTDSSELADEPTPVAVRESPPQPQARPPVQPKPAYVPTSKPAPKRTAMRVASKSPSPPPPPRVAKPIAVPAQLEATPTIDNEMCTEATCAAHGNERECCAPFREHPARLDRAAIARVIAAVKPNVLDCRDSQAEGVVKLAIQVGSDGRVTNTSVMESPEVSVGQCVTDKLRAAVFPPTDEGGSFVYRIDLTP